MTIPDLSLNQRSAAVAESMTQHADALRVKAHGRILDCGIDVPGGLEAGIDLARLTAGDLLSVQVTSGDVDGTPCPSVEVRTDHPVAACMAAQYAGWQIACGDYFAMGSGPFRAVYRGEDLFEHLGYTETSAVAVGALESRQLPSDEAIGYISEKTGLPAESIILAVAPTASLAGGLQVVARSVETALHKLHEIGFDIHEVISGHGSAPLPPPAKKDLAALGRTNDSILYGARVTLWVASDDDKLAELGAKVPSSTSSDYGAPFGEIFARYDHDFYKIDPHLFSPAEIVLHNTRSGRTHHFGSCNPSVLRRSFFES